MNRFPFFMSFYVYAGIFFLCVDLSLVQVSSFLSVDRNRNLAGALSGRQRFYFIIVVFNS